MPLNALKPLPDYDHPGSFTPSPFSLRLFTQDKTNLDAQYDAPYTGGRLRVLVIAADQRHLNMQNGTCFSTGNHPVETLLPMIHLHKAGFAFDIATLSGGAVMFEEWAMPARDQQVTDFRGLYADQFENPLKLDDVVGRLNGDCAAIFIPGGHGALLGLPKSDAVRQVLQWALREGKFIISICHGPAAFLALGPDNPLRGRRICAFPDLVDAMTPSIGYMPGKLTWKFCQKLRAQGIVITNRLATGATAQDGRLLTGDSPLASNALGKLAATELLKAARNGAI